MNIPGSDGIVYWNWANTTTGRLTASGLTFGDDIWCFTQGPRASEIWQNGILRATMAPGPSKSTYGANTEQLALGKAQGGANTSDLAKWKFVFIYWRQLQQRDITEITRNPFQWVDPRP